MLLFILLASLVILPKLIRALSGMHTASTALVSHNALPLYLRRTVIASRHGRATHARDVALGYTPQGIAYVLTPSDAASVVEYLASVGRLPPAWLPTLHSVQRGSLAAVVPAEVLRLAWANRSAIRQAPVGTLPPAVRRAALLG